MFTDMVGYTALTQRDERLALDLLERHRRRLRPLFAQHDGHEIKTLGDGFLVEFASPLEAVRCAIAIQGALRDDAAASPPERRVQVRIGIHLGDVVEREGDLVGDGVNLASRIQGVADPGGICISRPVFDQVRNKVDVPLVPLRSAQLKNVQVPMEVFRVASSSQAATAASPTRRAVRRAAALLVAATVAAGVWGLWAQRERRTTGSDRPMPSIAVLPFVNMSASAENEYLSDGISEEITGVLSRIAGLRVAARTSAFVFKGRNEDIENIGRQLHVGTVLEGSVQRAGNRLRITAQLIDAGNGYHLWSDTYDRDVADVFAIQSDVAERVAEALEVELGMETREQIRRPPTQNVEAYQLYLKGRYYTSRYTREAMAKGMEYFQQAIALDPSYALAYTGLGYYYAVSDDAPLPPREAITKMREAAEKAVAIDPTLGDAHGQLAAVRWWWDWDAAAAEREYRRAIELQEQSVLTHGLFALFLVS